MLQQLTELLKLILDSECLPVPTDCQISHSYYSYKYAFNTPDAHLPMPIRMHIISNTSNTDDIVSMNMLIDMGVGTSIESNFLCNTETLTENSKAFTRYRLISCNFPEFNNVMIEIFKALVKKNLYTTKHDIQAYTEEELEDAKRLEKYTQTARFLEKMSKDLSRTQNTSQVTAKIKIHDSVNVSILHDDEFAYRITIKHLEYGTYLMSVKNPYEEDESMTMVKNIPLIGDSSAMMHHGNFNPVDSTDIIKNIPVVKGYLETITKVIKKHILEVGRVSMGLDVRPE